jgi:cobaltochelatase CobS
MTMPAQTPSLITLSTNADSLKDRNLEFKSSEISIAVLASDLENLVEKPTLYAYRYGMIYDPNEDFKPNIERNQKIKGQLVADYWKQEDYARAEYERRLEAEKAKKGTSIISSNMNIGEIEELKHSLKLANEQILNKNKSILEKDLVIEELRKENSQNASSNTAQFSLLDNMIEKLKASIPQTIEVKINEKTNTIEKQVLHENFERVLNYIANKQAVYLHGNAGTGKSEIANQIAKALGLKFYPTQALSQEHKLTGYEDANGIYHPTQFYRAFKNGGLFMIDEIDASHPDVLVAINTALAQGYFDFNNSEGEIKAHPDFRCITAGNTIGTGATMDFTGRYAIDKSTLDRFFMVEIDYDIEIEKHIANNDMELVEFAHSIRQASVNSNIKLLFSYRSISRFATMGDKMDLTILMNDALLKGMAKDDAKMLISYIELDRNNKYLKALKKAC